MHCKDKGILRAIDVNFNRSKEGLRVIEDIYRFVFINDSLRKKTRILRHELDKIANEKQVKNAFLCRDSVNDLGKKVDYLETNRKSVTDILYANLQRVKESLRVLEEFFKLVVKSKVNLLKKIRYKVYVLEKMSRKLILEKNAKKKGK